MDSDHLLEAARAFLAEAQRRKLRLVTAESCTAGLIAATIGRVPGCSSVLERGFVTYSNDAKAEQLDVPAELIVRRGAVSKEVALAMAEGALAHSPAELAVAVTGIAGPDGGTPEKPVGLVHIAAARRGGARLHEEHRFGPTGREPVQAATAAAALTLLGRLLD
ncbi:MAG: CinA family protein [Hyphomonadaceae bacterium]|nr:CinA family protein [Hyphomonadaceae bacterium]MBX3510193.1 CinA family protein [Hyphomonadaceae bacterium]